MGKEGFSNPVTNAAGTLVRLVMKSVNYVANAAGWQISRDGDAEFNSVVVRGDVEIGPISPNPRLALTSNIPASLVNAFPLDFAWDSGVFFWFNGTDYEFEVIGTYLLGLPPFPIWAKGTYDTSNGVIFNEFEQGPGGGGATPVILFGSNVYNAEPIWWQYRNGAVTFTDSVTVDVDGGFKRGGYAGGIVNYGTITTGIAATSAGPEVAIPAATWGAFEPNATFRDGYMYRIEVEYGIGLTGAAIVAPLIRLRKGSATIVGQLIGGTVLLPLNSAFSFFAGTPFTVWIKNVSGADITTALTLSIAQGAAGSNARLYGVPIGPKLLVTIYYEGPETIDGVPHVMSSVAVPIT